ncbi:MAG: precorrin-3B C(17)-methyltransferase [Magnetococcales bacterium]|nr:precorrin-3B C(17)-methyltransferase [Magnetococcales bacterium]
MNTPPAPGRLLLVSIGPGHPDHLTQRAMLALRQADAVIGYKHYIAQIAQLLAAHQEIIGSGMRQELERCATAWKLAQAGRTVALISSGDVGIYGMAGPAFEVLLAAGWSPDSGVVVEVIPGVSAVNACAALVGAPLTHDFCTISLSDLLTPWPVIVKRLEAAASADFVTALYNPKSSKRTTQIEEARRIFLAHRPPATPVAVVMAACREGESITLTDLANMLHCPIDMETTVLIGNTASFIGQGRMVTPRGYTGKYDLERVLHGAS